MGTLESEVGIVEEDSRVSGEGDRDPRPTTQGVLLELGTPRKEDQIDFEEGKTEGVRDPHGYKGP